MSREPRRDTVVSTRVVMAEVERTSQGRARAECPDSVISRTTVLMVEEGQLGEGGNWEVGMRVASDVVLAETTTGDEG